MKVLRCTHKGFGGVIPELGTLYHHPYRGAHRLESDTLIFMSLGVQHDVGFVNLAVACIRVNPPTKPLANVFVQNTDVVDDRNVCVIEVVEEGESNDS